MSATEEIAWAVVWFPPEVESRTKVYSGPNAEANARALAARESAWAPLLERRTTTSEVVPL